MKTIYHSRETFYHGKPVYWYEFKSEGGNITINSVLNKFLRIPETIYYEYGGSHTEAIKTLTTAGITDIMKGKEI